MSNFRQRISKRSNRSNAPCPSWVKLRHARPNGLCLPYPRYRKRWRTPAAWSPVRTSAFQSACGEISRALFNAPPFGAPGVLGWAGDDLVNHDSVERAVNHQGVRDGQHRRAMSNDQRLGLGEAVTAEAIGLLRFNFTCLKGWFDMRNLGGVLDHEEPPAPSGMRSSAVASQDQRGVVRRRCDGDGTLRPSSSHAPRGRADRPCGLSRLILRGMRQLALVILNPNQIPRIDPAVARLAPKKMFDFPNPTPVGALAEQRPARSRFIE